MYLGQALYFRGGGLMNVLRASIFRYGALKQPHGHENRLIHSSTGGVGRVIEMLEVRSCGTVTPVDITLAQLRDEARVGTRELLQMERPLSSSTQPRILCPGHSIPFHLGAARGVIFPQKILLFVSPILSSLHPSIMAETLSEHFSKNDSSTPFEFRALESLLWAMASRQEKRVAYVSRVLAAVVEHQDDQGGRSANSPLLTLLPLSTTLSHYELVSRGLMQCVRGLLDSEWEQSQVCLSYKGSPPPEVLAQLEDLLEAVHHSAAGTTLAAVEMSRQLTIKRDLLQLHQRAFQNQILTENLHLTQAAVAVSASMWLTSIFGMNLTSGFETHHEFAFWGASTLSVILGLTTLALRRGGAFSGRRDGVGRGDAAPNLESLQEFLLKLDMRLDSARGTLTSCLQHLEASGLDHLSKETFCKIHVSTTTAASLSSPGSPLKTTKSGAPLPEKSTQAEAELLFDVLVSGSYGLELSKAELQSLESFLSDACEKNYTIRAGLGRAKF